MSTYLGDLCPTPPEKRKNGEVDPPGGIRVKHFTTLPSGQLRLNP